MTIKARFDGKVLVPEEPLDLSKDERVELDVRRAQTQEISGMTAGELATGEWVGGWADRDDINDSTEFVRELRRRIDRREL
ncbi:MAG: hypothetical protein QOE14_1732 [Humisphaera sp.]|nr:hypothetical protein [Humisphaera sp.]